MEMEVVGVSVTEYVCGFAFSSFGDVLLIEKKRPKWQAGRWNGVGGHVELGESVYGAMEREFREETGLSITNWDHFVTMHGDGWCVSFLRAFDADLVRCKTMTDERVAVWSSEHLPDVIGNLRWLIPCAYQREYFTFTVRERPRE